MTPVNEQQIKKKLEAMDKRYRKNIQFLKQQAPALYRQVMNCDKKPELSIESIDGGLMRRINGESAYPTGAIEHAMKEVKHFTETMNDKVYAPLPANVDLTHLIKPNSFSKTARLYADIIVNKGRVRLNPNNSDIFVFGVGLGYHIEMLCNLNRFSNITVIEQDTANFIASLYAIDWGNIIRSLKNHASLTLHIRDGAKDQEAFEKTLRSHCHRLFPSIGISTLIYNHEPDYTDYGKVKSIIEEYATHVKVSAEIIGPEAQRLFNANENIKHQYPCINLKESSISDHKKVCIVGAGPSLDIYADIIKKHRDQFFLISAGSTLSSLLRMDIKPDLHFELEFQNLATEWIAHINEQYSLKDLDLVCTFEANPGFPPLFRHAYMFIPESSELQPVFKEAQTLRRGGITCTNGATALAINLTDQPIYLFGLDFAYTGGQHHSNKNISRDDDLPENLKKIKTVADSRKATHKTMGNLGEPVLTSVGLNSARLTMENLLEVIPNTLFNCTHGAKIKGTRFLSETELLEQLSVTNDTDHREALNISTETINVEQVFQRTDDILATSIKSTEKAIELVSNFSNDAKENNRLSKLIFNELLKYAKGDPGKARNIMSVSKYPLLQLYIVTNYTDDSEQEIIVQSWINEYKDYIRFLAELFDDRKKQRNYLVTEDWMK